MITSLQPAPVLLASFEPGTSASQNASATRMITPEALNGALRNVTTTSTKTTIVAAKRRFPRSGIKEEFTDDNLDEDRPLIK